MIVSLTQTLIFFFFNFGWGMNYLLPGDYVWHMFTFFQVQIFSGRISILNFPAPDHLKEKKKHEPQIDLHVSSAFYGLHYGASVCILDNK